MEEKQRIIAGATTEQLFHEGDLQVVNTLTDAASLADFVGQYHVHIVCRGGQAAFSVGDKQFKIEPGDMAIWQMGAAIDNISQSDAFDADVLLVSKIFLIENNPENLWATRGYVYIKEHPVFALDKEAWTTIEADFHRFSEMISSTHLFRREILGKLMQVFLYDLWNILSSEIERQGMASSVRASLFYRFMDLIRQHAAEHREITFYSDLLCVTSKYLSEVCRDESGYPASHWINGYATQELVAMLKNQELSLTEIADRMHFYNQAHFSRYVKNALGQTPTEYRRSLSSL